MTHRKCSVETLSLLTIVAASITVQAQPTMSVTRVANGLSQPVFASSAPGDPSRMFIVEQGSGSTANIRIFNQGGGLNSTPFLTVTGLSTGGERGLLGMAFHPGYQTNGRFYVNFTNTAGNTVVQEYTRQSATIADPLSARQIMSVTQPFSNHNGGWLGFGADNYLYIGMGDGGSSNDPQNNAQNKNSLLGKMLRVDVNGDDFAGDPTRNYSNPMTNPFFGAVDGADEVWAYGLRNPWRNSFDRLTGDLYIADVGQGAREEINVQRASSLGGENYGWKVREGTSGGFLAGAIDPIYNYTHGSGNSQGFSVTGGYVYRGPLAQLQGHYFFADYITNRIWSLKWDGSDPTTFNGTNYTDFIDWTDILTTDFGSITNISSFAEDSLGNLYIIDRNGEMFMISAASVPEPASCLLLAGGLGLVLFRRGRRFR